MLHYSQQKDLILHAKSYAIAASTFPVKAYAILINVSANAAFCVFSLTQKHKLINFYTTR